MFCKVWSSPTRQSANDTFTIIIFSKHRNILEFYDLNVCFVLFKIEITGRCYNCSAFTAVILVQRDSKWGLA